MINGKPKSPGHLRKALRSRHYSLRNGRTCTIWTKPFTHYLNIRHPAEVAKAKINALVIRSKAGGSIQRQGNKAANHIDESLVQKAVRDAVAFAGLMNGHLPDLQQEIPKVVSRTGNQKHACYADRSIVKPLKGEDYGSHVKLRISRVGCQCTSNRSKYASADSITPAEYR